MRGKHAPLGVSGQIPGITPAHAGKTLLRCGPSRTAWDHPRACGENIRAGLHLIAGMGSPPRMRGKHAAGRQHDRDAGITPAHAGKTNGEPWCQMLVRDHPRACGENKRKRTLRTLSEGSPPRMRGKLIGTLCYSVVLRITPAHAGKTCTVRFLTMV